MSSHPPPPTQVSMHHPNNVNALPNGQQSQCTTHNCQCTTPQPQCTIPLLICLEDTVYPPVCTQKILGFYPKFCIMIEFTSHFCIIEEFSAKRILQLLLRGAVLEFNPNENSCKKLRIILIQHVSLYYYFLNTYFSFINDLKIQWQIKVCNSLK